MRIEETRNKRILFAALNWGMGHVSRSISIIRELRENGNEVIIAGSENQKRIFEEYFPALTYVGLNDYPFTFSGSGNFALDLLKSGLKLNEHLKEERRLTEELVQKYDVNVVLSDHRYGFHSGKVPSIFITHQLSLPVKWYQKRVNNLHCKLMQKFDAVWIVDREDNYFAGKLSVNPGGINAHYIGPRSRFENCMVAKEGYSLAIISGPVPYDQQLLDLIQKQTEFHPVKFVGNSSLRTDLSTIMVSGTWKERDELICNAEMLISRSGYSTIMDAYFLKKQLIMFPTPGQAEQQYLYNLWKDRSFINS